MTLCHTVLVTCHIVPITGVGYAGTGAQEENTLLFVKNASRIHERNIYWLFCALWPSLVLPAPCYAPPSIVCSLPTLTCTPHPLLCSPICCLCSLSPHLCSQPLVVLPYPSFTLSWPSLMLTHLLQCAPHPLFMLPLFVVHSTPFTLGLCSFTLVQPCVPSVCACCCCSYCG